MDGSLRVKCEGEWNSIIILLLYETFVLLTASLYIKEARKAVKL